MADPLQTALTKVAAVNKEYDADVFLFSGGITDTNYGAFIKEIAKTRKHPNALMIVATNGGYATAGFKISRLLQGTFKQHFLYVPRECYSAGTLLALGAHRLIIDQFAELGPLDVQLPKPNEIGSRKSGLVSRAAFDTMTDISFSIFERFMLGIKTKSGGAVTFDVAAQLAATMAAAMVTPVLGKIDPDSLGSDYRDLIVASEYGERLANKGGNVKPGAVQTLVSGYPAHNFIIDEHEAKELFKRIERPSDTLYQLIGSITKYAFTEANPSFIMKLEVPDAQPTKTRPKPTQTNLRKRAGKSTKKS
ncbi:MAG: hypothetical protein FP825_12670 [Hyphomonas sp.]|uniref:SDH family Clp fold serine proteinase n=1 Tax=Hyphomonas sp. TaxID=87 RepID=UPI0018148140|nr:hypothetical protein [Hyphomonas sp.]MBA3069316.1 hypothetical protein [Hyphomonas sp.]MBU4063697.1 hypothetical protein [Alphaproteobacteria bacterium]MBU4164342.1 hypothetical protein [Alphaproteobacteria bacterium]